MNDYEAYKAIYGQELADLVPYYEKFFVTGKPPVKTKLMARCA